MARGWAVLFFLAAEVGAFADDSLVSIGDAKYLAGPGAGGKIAYLRYPTLGCPSIVQAGSTGTVWIKLNGATASTFLLDITPNSKTGPAYALSVLGSTYDASTGITKVAYEVGSNVPEDTYDLHLSVPALAVSDLQYNCFKVVKEESADFRFIVIADTHFNTPTGFWLPGNHNPGGYDAYSIIEQMKKEIRALRPTFVLLIGDLMFGLNYDTEYETVWGIWKDAGFPIFMIPGNHDGYASIKDRWLLGLHSPKRDGLDYWRNYFGPCAYSFEFGGVHFQGVNTMDGTPERRDGFLIVIENYGGDLGPEQMDWISADLAGVNGPVVPFLHHNPMGEYRANKTFSMSGWVLSRILEFLTTGNLNEFVQEWNTQATGEFLLAKYAGRPLVFVGHKHIDDLKIHNGTTYKYVTTAGAGAFPGKKDYWGYAYVTVQNSQVVEHLYTSDPKFQSVPTGNLHVRSVDGEGAEQSAKITSGLSKSYGITVEFVMPSAPAYVAANGFVVQFAPIDAERTRVWVRTASPVAPSIHEPQSLTVTLKTAEAAVGGSVETPVAPPSGGGGCGAIGLEALLILGLLYFFSSSFRKRGSVRRL